MQSAPQKILVNAPVHPEALRVLEREGYIPVVVSEWDADATWREAPGCAGMVANAVFKVGGAFFEHAPSIRVVGRMGVGYDNIDTEAARRRGVRVVNTPLPVIEPVAEHTIALLLALTRKVLEGDRAVREGRFRAEDNAPGPELRGKTLGVVGMGATGRRVAEIARFGFGMEILYADRVARPEVEEALGARRVELDLLLARSHFVTVHVNLAPDTRGLIGRREIGLMRPGAYLVNVSRGPVVDTEAVREALETGHLAGAGVDVFPEEPPPPGEPLLSAPNTVLTPHRAGWSPESHLGCSLVVEDVIRVLKGEEPRHPVV